MKQLVQTVAGGPVRLIEVPRPTIGPTEVLVRTVTSVISPGTERAVTALAQANIVAKAKARPDLVRQVVAKARVQGVAPTVRAVRSRMAEDLPLGYSAAGVAIEVGEAVTHVRPGQMVATGGAGKANHAEFQAVPGLLCTPVPAGVAVADAAFCTIAAIALHGVRSADVSVGGKIVVVGLGLVGQLAVRLGLAAGCDTFGVDVNQFPLDIARSSGSVGSIEGGGNTTAAVLEWSRGRGADAVIVCASNKSSGVMARVPTLCRDRATVVVVGDVGLHLDRRAYYERELSVRLSRSYGPGRYERSYEEWGVDYPAGQLRWTEGRNQEAVLDLLAARRLHVSDLVTHRYPIENAASAYAMIEARNEPCLGVLVDYPTEERFDLPVVLHQAARAGPDDLRVGWVGAGSFSTSTLLPAFKKAGMSHFEAVTSASGLSAHNFAQRSGFQRAVTGADAVIDDPAIDVVVIATPHDSHSKFVSRALKAGKHVWVEKPLALSHAELDEVDAARHGRGILYVGFNRRFSPAVRSMRKVLVLESGPTSVIYRVAAGQVPDSHWYRDRRQGGRLLGEVCHFVDTCQAIVDQPVRAIRALAGGNDEGMLATDFTVMISYGDGSLATIHYCSVESVGFGKERIEVLRGRTQAVIDDYRKLIVNGKAIWSRAQDKGHNAAVSEFVAAVRRGRHDPVEDQFLATTRAMLDAAGTLLVRPRVV